MRILREESVELVPENPGETLGQLPTRQVVPTHDRLGQGPFPKPLRHLRHVSVSEVHDRRVVRR